MTKVQQPAVAVVGLGRIGSGIARSLLRAGLQVRVHNRTAAKGAPLVREGAQQFTSPAEAASGADVVVTSTLDDAALRALVQGGLLAGMSANAIHVSTATVSPLCSNELAWLHAAHRQGFLAAPVLGRPEVAAAGELTSLIGGPADLLERARFCIEAYSARVLHTGETPGTANSLKLAFNFYIAATAELFGEFLAFTEKSGIEHELAMQALRGLQGHPGVAYYLECVGARDFDAVGFEMEAGLKDLGLMLDAASAVRCPLPLAALVRDRTLTALAIGLGEKDWAGFTEIARRSAGLS